jgi:hypothetical protein
MDTRLRYLVGLVMAAMTAGCGGERDAVSAPPTSDPLPKFPSVAGSWRGTVNYRACEETGALGVCASLHVPRSMPFQATITQTSQTRVASGLTVADVAGTISFDGLTGNFTGIIDDIGSIFFDSTFVAPAPPDRTVRLTDWIGQLDGAAFFSYFRMFIRPTGGGMGQAIVTANMTDIVRLGR